MENVFQPGPNYASIIKKPLHAPLNFNNTNVKQTAFQKHLDLILESQLSFEKHL